MKKQLSFFFTLMYIIAFGQTISTPKIIPPTPSAQNFMRYGEIPIDYSTGVPNIDIPLYTIKGNKISLPISISYHASGIKVDDIASEIGLGWVMNCSGLVSRTINGNRDEVDVALRSYFNSSQLYTDLNNKAYQYQCDSGSLIGAYNLQDVLKNRLNDIEDLMSDRYYYQIPGVGSGVFTYDYSVFNNKQNSAITLPYRPIKIKNNVSTLNSFEITDENGTVYTFKSFYTDNRTVSEWYLSKIVSANGTEEIKLNYVAQNQGKSYTRWDFVFQSAITNSLDINCGPADYGPSSSLTFSPVRQFTTPVLSSIESNSEIINFVYESRSDFLYLKRLKEITVSSKDSPTIVKKKIQFAAKYFNSLDNVDKRLALDYLTISNPADTDTQKYAFKYNEINKLPPYPENMANRRYSVDFWGYYNGAYNTTNIPMEFLPPQNSSTYGGDRNASSDQATASAFMLQEIKYPTGGKTAFEFERHYANYLYTYKNASGVPINKGGYIGGFRVKKISNFKSDTDINPEIKSYLYNEAVLALPKQEYFSHDQRFTERIDIPGDWGAGIPDDYCWTDYQRKIVYSEPFFPMEIAPGLTIMYPSVTEVNGTLGNNAGKTVYRYSIPESSVDYYNNPDHPFEFESEFFYHPNHYDKGNYVPKLVDKEVYDSSGNKVYDEHNQYDNYFENTYNTGIKLTRTKIYHPLHFAGNYTNLVACCSCTAPLTTCQAGGLCTPVIQDFLASVIAIDTKCYSKASLLTYTLKKTYDQLDSTKSISETINYKYNQHNLKEKEISVTNSSGENIVTSLKYPNDFYSTFPYNVMVDRNITTPVIEQTTKNEGVQIQKIFNEYKNWGNNIIEPEFVKYQKDTQSALENRIRFLSYDEKGNVLSLMKEDGAPISYIWGYNKTLPIAEVVNSKSAEQIIPQTDYFFDSSFNNLMYLGQEYVVGTFTLTETKEITFNRSYSKNNDHPVTFYVSILGPSSQTVYDNLTTSQTDLSFSGSYTLSPGNYTVKINAGYGGINGPYQHDINLSIMSNGEKKINIPFYTSFEEDQQGVNTAYAKTGKKSRVGNYSITIPPSSLGYSQVIVSYWAKTTNSSPWTYVENIVNTGNGSDYLTGVSYAYIDEVRVYPVNAQMRTFAYDPFFKVQTSIMGPDNRAEYYEYDGFGRLKEIYIKESGDIKSVIKSFNYNYKPFIHY